MYDLTSYPLYMSRYTDTLKTEVEHLFVDRAEFHKLAKDVLRFQRESLVCYDNWCKHAGFNYNKDCETFPTMHISAWKQHEVYHKEKAEVVYTSSATTGKGQSIHKVFEKSWYLDNALRGFEYFYGCVSEFCILGLLPSYLERSGSSLVDMVQFFVERSSYDSSGTYLYEFDKLYDILMSNKENSIPTILIGVSFGLLDFIEEYTLSFPELIVMETGGMKGKRAELTKEELHKKLKVGFGVTAIHSEYGMTELLSQAYSKGDGVFYPSPTMAVFTTEINDPFTRCDDGAPGLINIIDLANVDSCSFILTDDLGVSYRDGSFRVLGRLDNSDLRGCNLMVSDFK